MTLLQQAKTLLTTIPHLTDPEREYWHSQLNTLNTDQLTALITVLQEEQKNFDAALETELKKDKDNTIIGSLKSFLTTQKQKNTKALELHEKEEAEASLQSMIDKI